MSEREKEYDKDESVSNERRVKLEKYTRYLDKKKLMLTLGDGSSPKNNVYVWYYKLIGYQFAKYSEICKGSAYYWLNGMIGKFV